MKVKDLTKKQIYYPSILIMGPLGRGKTAFVGQAGAKGHLMDFDQGWKTLETLQDKYTQDRVELDLEVFYEPSHLKPTQFPQARAHLGRMIRESRKPDWPYKVSIIDSLTGLARCVKLYTLGTSGRAGENPQIQDWGVMLNELENFLNLWRSLPAIKILTAHDQITFDSDGAATHRLLCPGRNLPSHIAGLFDDVLFIKLKKKAGAKYEFTLTSQPTAALEVRTRTNFHQDWNMDDGFWPFIEKLGYKDGFKELTQDVSKPQTGTKSQGD